MRWRHRETVLASLLLWGLLICAVRASLDSPPTPLNAQTITGALGYAPMPPTFAQKGSGTAWTGAAANSAEVSLLGSGTGSAAISCPYEGATWRFSAGGLFSTALTPGNITPKVKFGSGSVSRTITNILASANNAAWKGALLLTCVTIGTSGTMRAVGEVAYATGDTSQAYAQINNDGAVITLDNTGSMAIDVRVLMASANAANVFRLDVFAVERVY